MVPGNKPYPLLSNVPGAEPVEAYYPASLAQRRLWFLDRLQGPTSAYNVHVGLWLYGPIDLCALHASLREVVNRHESLRTTFRLERNDLIQVVTSDESVELPFTDFGDAPEPYPRVYERARRFVETPFDLSQRPLFRAEVFRITPEEHVLLCVMHHAITDAWSLQILVKELTVFYQGLCGGTPVALPPLPIQYGDYAEWQHRSLKTEIAEKQLAYWKDALQDPPALLELPQDGIRPEEQTFRGATRTFAVPGDIIDALELLAPTYQATLFMVLLAAFKVLLYRYSGEPDVLVGVPVAGRSQVETEALIGFFVDTVVLRDDLWGNPQFADLLARVRETTLGALANAEVPFEKIVEAIQPERSLSYNPIFQVMFSVIKSAIRSHAFGKISSYPYVVNSDSSIFDLSATFIEDSDGKWWLQLDYSTDLYRSERIDRMFKDYAALLQAIASAPESRIDDLPLSIAAPAIAAPGAAPAASKSSQKNEQRRSRRVGSRSATARATVQQEPEPKFAEQVLLAEVWKDVLGIPSVGIHDNFFDIGGHSLLAARLVAQIEDATGRKIPLSAVLRAPTIDGLARLLKENSELKPDPLLTQLHRGGEGASFFAVAAPSVDSSGFVLLSRHMGTDHPVYKLQSPGPLIWGRPFEKEELRALAREYVAAMRTVQPRGPLHLGAMCDGVQIAQQMILELESQGEEVALFAIFDTWVLENSQIPLLWAVDYYRSRLRSFLDLTFEQQLASLKKVLRRAAGREPHSGNENWKKAYWPGEDFEPPRFQAPIMLFKRPKQPFFYVRDPLMGWGERSTGGVEVHEIECGHYEMLRPPQLQVIGQTLVQRLAGVDKLGKDSDMATHIVTEQPTRSPEVRGLTESAANLRT